MSKLLVSILASILFTGTAMAEADADAGRKVINQCRACHSCAKGNHSSGPSLYGVVGSKAGSVEGYRYSHRPDRHCPENR